MKGDSFVKKKLFVFVLHKRLDDIRSLTLIDLGACSTKVRFELVVRGLVVGNKRMVRQMASGPYHNVVY